MKKIVKSGVLLLCGLLLWNLLYSAGAHADGGYSVYPNPASGSYQENSQFTMDLYFSSTQPIDGELSITFQTGGNVQYVGTQINNSEWTDPQLQANGNGSYTLAGYVYSNNPAPVLDMATVTVEAGSPGQASLALSGFYYDGGSDDYNLSAQDGNYTIEAPAPAPTPAPPAPTPKPPVTTSPKPVTSSKATAATIATPAAPVAAATQPVKTSQSSNILPVLKKPASSAAAKSSKTTGKKAQPKKPQPKISTAAVLIPILSVVILVALILFIRLWRRAMPPLSAPEPGAAADTKDTLAKAQPKAPLPQSTVSQLPSSIATPLPVNTLPTVAYANKVLPLPRDPIEEKIDKAFYPLQAHAAAEPPHTSTASPPDMFDLAKQHPESYGNPLYGVQPAQMTGTPPVKPPAVKKKPVKAKT